MEFSSYIFRFLPIPIALLRALPYRMGLSRVKSKDQNIARDHAVKGGVITRIMGFVLNSEIENLKTNNAMNFGGSCLVVARSP